MLSAHPQLRVQSLEQQGEPGNDEHRQTRERGENESGRGFLILPRILIGSPSSRRLVSSFSKQAPVGKRQFRRRANTEFSNFNGLRSVAFSTWIYFEVLFKQNVEIWNRVCNDINKLCLQFFFWSLQFEMRIRVGVEGGGGGVGGGWMNDYSQQRVLSQCCSSPRQRREEGQGGDFSTSLGSVEKAEHLMRSLELRRGTSYGLCRLRSDSVAPSRNLFRPKKRGSLPRVRLPSLRISPSRHAARPFGHFFFFRTPGSGRAPPREPRCGRRSRCAGRSA